MKHPLKLAVLAACAVVFASTSASADVERGKKLFKTKCQSCHKMDEHAKGPMLSGVIGRKAGGTDFKQYKALEGADFVWDEANLSEWIADPKKFIGKSTTMAGKIKKEADPESIIEYLKNPTD